MASLEGSRVENIGESFGNVVPFWRPHKCCSRSQAMEGPGDWRGQYRYMEAIATEPAMSVLM